MLHSVVWLLGLGAFTAVTEHAPALRPLCAVPRSSTPKHSKPRKRLDEACDRNSRTRGETEQKKPLVGRQSGS